MICAVLIPGVFLYFAGQLVVGPLLWASRSLRLQGETRRLLGPGLGLGLDESSDPDVRAVLSRVALVGWSARARDFFATYEGLEIYVRTQPRTVGPDGEPLRFPWTRKERTEAQQVIGLSVAIDAAGRLRDRLDLHVALGRDDAIVGDEALAIGLLSSDVRQWTSPGDQLTISDQLISYDSPLGLQQPTRPEERIKALVRMTHRLLAVTDGVRIDRAALLLENLRGDPTPAVRARSADMLLDRFPETADETFAAALDDSAPDVRFAAARHLAQDGFEFVLAVLDDEASSDGLRERALRYLLRNFPSTRVLTVLEDMVRHQKGSLRNIAIRHLGELKHEPAVKWMAGTLTDADDRTLVDIATALADIGATESEPLLRKLLYYVPLDVQLAAVDALGTVGQLPTVQLLLPLTKGRMTDARLQLAALTAIRMIQTRHARTGAGALSVVDEKSDAGGLSIAPPEGSVSLHEAEEEPKASS